VDYEVELGFVMGRRARFVRAAEAMDYVLGYLVLNDVSARDYQFEKPAGQWYLAKSFDTFCPMGPWIVSKDEIADPHSLRLSCEVSGELLQSSDTGQMVFRIPEIVDYVSQVLTLEPGDVVGTGTPAGVGFARKPPRWLRSGDVVRCTVEGIGTLENPVR
jgi:2-keto-4-pentenoate hydratase/2-oxohepta-3-ene-1,7-dioic acid hydratase in catechol pathway